MYFFSEREKLGQVEFFTLIKTPSYGKEHQDKH